MRSTLFLCLFLLVFTLAEFSNAHLRMRTPKRIPDIPGFKTLICDLHIHTVFSDGEVWPSVRAEEAWREGLDVIAITDHLEYLPHEDDIRTNHNRSGEIADAYGKSLNLTVIRGSEITREMPPGHLNAIFIKDANRLAVETWEQAVSEAVAQDAFIFWNHPGWKGQQEDGVARWYPEHAQLLEAGQLHGIEVVNEREYYPEAHRWCLEKNLTMLSNSDIHAPINMHYDVQAGDTRPVTLVFAQKNEAGSVKEALFNQRTAVLWRNMLIGKEIFLRPIFEQSIRIENAAIRFSENDHIYVQITNTSEIDIDLVKDQSVQEIITPDRITLAGGKTILFSVKKTQHLKPGRKEIQISYKVSNFLIAPETPLPIKLTLDVEQN